jgi:hypothetical protein
MSIRMMVNNFANITGQEGTKELYLTLIKEELEEWEEELGGSPEKELKELSDLVYVIYGYARAADIMVIPEIVQKNKSQHVVEAVDAWIEEYGCGSRRREHYLLEVALGYIYSYAKGRKWDLDEAVRRVHQNNVGRCVQPDGTVHRRVDGKIIKNDGYPKVTLEDLV